MSDDKRYESGLTNTLWIVNTRRCNLDCFYCYQGSHAKVPAGLRPFMPDEVLERVERWVPDWALRGLQINWYGGEPLLGVDQISRWTLRLRDALLAKGKVFQAGITTNGTLLDERARAVIDASDIGVLMSLDGPKRTHDKSRTYYGGRGSWDDIPVAEIIAWRPRIEIAWQLDPKVDWNVDDLDELLGMGFKNINFNLQWLAPWPEVDRIRLEVFMRGVARRCIQGRMNSNFFGKLEKALTSQTKMAVPCGTGMQMLAVTPEGWLYPSQEMAFTAFEPGRAPGTPEHYRVGDVFRTPVIDALRLVDVAAIKTSQMKPPPPYDCSNCIASSVSIGGCHCRYIGQDGMDPSNRFEVAEGYCPSMISAVTGLVQGAAIEGRVSFQKTAQAPQAPPREPTLAQVMSELQAVRRTLAEVQYVRLEAVGEEVAS